MASAIGECRLCAIATKSTNELFYAVKIARLVNPAELGRAECIPLRAAW
ncbi:hypothetical protein GHK47_00220 [Sinorhizobium meliloti]|nr:hypothetical protein [Sinorhizobium meliloti]MQV31581.1 hypothetical protein [Sinorhizobium meliloti]